MIADDDLHDFYTDLLKSTSLILYGRVTYELMASYWPTASADPSLPPAMLRFANAINPIYKLVFSTTLKQAGWNTQVVNHLDPEAIKNMKATTQGNILLGGGASLARTFIELGLLDEIQLMVQPSVIGAGKGLFQGLDQGLKLVYQWIKPFPSGAVALSYALDGKI